MLAVGVEVGLGVREGEGEGLGEDAGGGVGLARYAWAIRPATALLLIFGRTELP